MCPTRPTRRWPGPRACSASGPTRSGCSQWTTTSGCGPTPWRSPCWSARQPGIVCPASDAGEDLVALARSPAARRFRGGATLPAGTHAGSTAQRAAGHRGAVASITDRGDGVGKRSAGILLYRRAADGVEVLLVHPGGPVWARRDAGAWSIPKGEYGDGEDPLAVAMREFEEETGQPPPTGEP